jgi:hypothetical protein
MTTREIAVSRTETKEQERRGWPRIRSAIAAVVSLPLLLVGVLVDAGVWARMEEDGDGVR